MGLSAAHNGESFGFRLKLNEALSISDITLRDERFQITQPEHHPGQTGRRSLAAGRSPVMEEEAVERR